MLATLALAALILAPVQQDTTIPVSRGTRLEMNNRSGQIVVRTWNRNAVQVSADLSNRDRLQIDDGGGVLRVRNQPWRGDDNADFRLTVPAWMELDLQTVDGDITVQGSEARVDLRSVEGNVSVQGGRDFISIHSVEGEITVAGAQGRVEANTVDGGVGLTDIKGDVSVSAVDGDITLDGISSAQVEATTVDGDILYRGNIAANGRYRFDSHSGDVTLEVPDPLNATLSISTFDGDFQSDWPIVLTGTHGMKKRFSFTLGDGSARIDIQSFDGDMRLRKRGR
jgi:DUF4097 and DUF4098 domain-containing protein YvlB